jgi:hypothetical protein
VRWDGIRGGEPHMWAKPGRLGPKVEEGGELLCDDDVRLLFYHILFYFQKHQFSFRISKLKLLVKNKKIWLLLNVYLLCLHTSVPPLQKQVDGQSYFRKIQMILYSLFLLLSHLSTEI